MRKLEDIFDLYYFSRSNNLGEDELHTRDRAILIAEEDDLSAASSHLDLLTLWLLSRRASFKQETNNATQGELLAHSFNVLKILLFVLGLVLGAVIGGSYFVYTGETPLNVFSYFALFIVPQLLLVTLLLFKSIFIGAGSKTLNATSGIIIPLLKNWLNALAWKLRRRDRSSQAQRAHHSFPLVEDHLLFYPLFLYAQLFGVAVNISLLAVTSIKIATTDLAFGWQTTLQLGAEKLFALVKIIATPWSWILPETLAYPSLEHIEGSRIILKDGIYNLATESLISWWPFLLLSLLFYGLLPRLMLAIWGKLMEKRAYSRYLNSARFLRITERMRTPVVVTHGEPNDKHTDDQHVGIEPSTTSSDSLQNSLGSAVLLVPIDLYSPPSRHILSNYLSMRGYTIDETYPVFQSYDDDLALLNKLSDLESAAIVVLEAWMAPIKEQLGFIQRVCSAPETSQPLGILLVGKPVPDGSIKPPHPQDVALWQEAISSQCPDIAYFIPEENIQ